MRVFSSIPRKVAILTLILLAFAGCEVPVVAPDPGDVAIAPRPPGPGPTAPGAPAPTDPGAPEAPADDPTSAPTDLLQVTTQGDSLFASSAAHVGVGQTVQIPIRMRVTGERTFAVIVGQEAGACTGKVEIVGIVDDGTAGSNRSLGPAGLLTPADAFTAWFAGACYLLAWKVPFGPGGGTYAAEIIVRGLEPGETLVRTQFEVLGFRGQSFRWVVHSQVDVIP